MATGRGRRAASGDRAPAHAGRQRGRAGHGATVQAIVVADERTDDAGTVERLLRQYAENEHREVLTNAERLGVVEQLSLLNVSAAQIAKRTG
jgi:hypothetical protein